MLYIGVDLGTSAVKLLLMDGTGKIQKIVSKEYQLYFPHPGWSEQKPEDWYHAAVDTIRSVLTKSGVDKKDVVSMGISGQMHGLVMLDEAGNVLRPSIIWCDQRTAAECDLCGGEIYRGRRYYRINGQTVCPDCLADYARAVFAGFACGEEAAEW
mgnify:CR=1 FL=1